MAKDHPDNQEVTTQHEQMKRLRKQVLNKAKNKVQYLLSDTVHDQLRVDSAKVYETEDLRHEQSAIPRIPKKLANSFDVTLT